jgi:hypothetical protein
MGESTEAVKAAIAEVSGPLQMRGEEVRKGEGEVDGEKRGKSL